MNKFNLILSLTVLIFAFNATANTACPSSNSIKDTLNYLFHSKNEEDRTLVANCVFLKANLDYGENLDAARFYSESLIEQIRAAKQIGEKDDAYKIYLKRAIIFGEKIVTHIENNSENIPLPKNGSEGAYRKFISNAMKGYAEATILISASEAKSAHGENFSKKLGKLPALHVISRDTIIDYGKAVNSCPEWNFKSGTDKNSKSFKSDMCSTSCLTNLNLFMKQLTDWKKATLIELNNDGKENLKRLISLKC